MILNVKVELKGTRGNSSAEFEEREVTLYAVIEEGKSGLVFQLEGGPTGYESFYVTPEKDEHGSLHSMMKDGWIACCGTKSRWDSLKISGDEMRRVFKALGVIGPPEMKVKISHHDGGLADRDLTGGTGWGDHGENHGHG